MKTYKTDFEIRFILFWNGSRIPFLKKKISNGFWNLFCFFLKRISWYVSHNQNEKEKYKIDINKPTINTQKHKTHKKWKGERKTLSK